MTTRKTELKPRLPGWLAALLLALLVLVAILLLDMGAAALEGWLTQRQRAELERAVRREGKQHQQPHPVFHHGLTPNLDDVAAEWGPTSYRLSTNSLGFKDASPRQVELTPERHRVLVIGDSYAEGVGVPYEQTFAGLLARRLPQVEVLNASAISYSPVIYQRKIRYLVEEIGLELDEVVVFLDISDIQDEAVYYAVDAQGNVVRNRARIRRERAKGHDMSTRLPAGEGAPYRPCWLEQHTLLTRRLIQRLRADEGWVREFQQITRFKRGMWTIDENLMAEYGARGLELAQQNMDRLLEVTRRHGIAMTLVVYPWPDQLIHDDRESLQVTTWRAWARARGVTFIDLFPDFFRLAADHRRLESLYLKGDNHWSPAGHAFVSDALLRRWRPAGNEP